MSRKGVWMGLGMIVFFVYVLFLPAAFAYIDPGAASYFLQMLIAGVLGVLFALKVYWRRLVGVFRRSPASHNPSATSEPAASGDSSVRGEGEKDGEA